ncbi:hypothetical protein OCE25_26830 [Bacillus cereus]|nr:hypothetical protein [Bacillus cereus]
MVFYKKHVNWKQYLPSKNLSEGLSAMLGDSGDLPATLIKQIQDEKKTKGTTEKWVTHASVRAWGN